MNLSKGGDELIRRKKGGDELIKRKRKGRYKLN
jgi:hypothetical protein